MRQVHDQRTAAEEAGGFGGRLDLPMTEERQLGAGYGMTGTAVTGEQGAHG